MWMFKFVINFILYVEGIYLKVNNRFEKKQFVNSEILIKRDGILFFLY